MSMIRKVDEFRGCKILRKIGKNYYIVKFPNGVTSYFNDKRYAKSFISRADKDRFDLEESDKSYSISPSVPKRWYVD